MRKIRTQQVKGENLRGVGSSIWVVLTAAQRKKVWDDIQGGLTPEQALDRMADALAAMDQYLQVGTDANDPNPLSPR